MCALLRTTEYLTLVALTHKQAQLRCLPYMYSYIINHDQAVRLTTDRMNTSLHSQYTAKHLKLSPTQLYEHLMHILVYLGRSRNLGTTFSAHVPDADKLIVYTDSDWGVMRSTTGFVILLAGAAIVAVSCRVSVRKSILNTSPITRPPQGERPSRRHCRKLGRK